MLGRLPEIAHVNVEGRRRLLDAFNEAEVPAGTTVLCTGDRVAHLYLVAGGTVSTTTDDGSLVLVGANQPVALRRLFDDERLTGPIVAVTDVELWTMTRASFLAACKDIPGFALGLLEAAA
jgi:CRP-like cAMP-binding protein